MSFWRWLFRLGLSKQEFQEQEEHRKHLESGQQMVNLTARRETLSVSQILNELEEMHCTYAIALWPEYGRVFIELITEIRSRHPTKEDMFRFLTMLTWPEFRQLKDRTAAHEILRIAAQVPNSAFLPILWQHLDWLKEVYGQFISQSELFSQESQQIMFAREIEGYTPIPYRSDEMGFQRGIEGEIRLTEKLISS